MSPPDPSQTQLAQLEDAIVDLTRQLDEARSYGYSGEVNGREGGASDDEFAKRVFQQELEAQLQLLKDTKVAHSIAMAVDSDAEALSSSARDEDCAMEDRNLAIRMATDDPELENPPPGVVERPRAVLIEDDLSRKVSALIIADDSLYSDPSIEGESSIPHVESQAQALKHLSQNRFECCTCTERYRWDKITQLACGDYYCTPCLRRVILRAVTERDLTYLPPRCCRTSIPREIIETLLSAEEKSEFRLAELEKDTVDKTYCSGSQCGKFIPPSDIYAGEAKCYACGATTCSLCKNSSHQSDCPKDQALQATLELAVAQHWQRCYSCKALVEIKHGCNHITCRCGAEFCYLCGASWRTCRCQLFTEANLLRRAAQVVDRVAPAALHAQERQRQIARMQHNLRTAEECDHSGGYRNFEQIEGDREQPFRCDMCDAQHWLFILRCRRCHIDICVRCRHNRI